MRGWTLTIVISAAVLALTGLQIGVWGGGEEGIRVVVRSTARSSIVLFSLAFAAASLRALWQSPASAWLLANRRYLGVSYAVSHALHAAALVALYGVSEPFVRELNAVTLGGGGLAYAFTAAMAFTSSDAAVRALGRSRWRRLHLVGGWYIWAIFAQSYLGRAVETAAYWPHGLLVLAVPALRIARWARSREDAVSRDPARLPAREGVE